jgi:hypothetical protein
MTRGEEAFQDANGDGVYTAGEAFVDQGDAFIDANDNNAYDAAPANGLPEVRFCGLNADCSTYHGPNAVWDADTVIWKPAWVVFTAGVGATTTPNTGVVPASDFTLACADYADATVNASHNSVITAVVYVYDHWLNLPSAGATTTIGSPTVSGLKVDSFGFSTGTLETWGSMGVLGFDFDWVRVSAANNLQPCSAATSPCIEQLVFGTFSDGFAGIVNVSNPAKTPLASDPKGVSSTGFGCAPTPDQYGVGSFLLPIDVVNAHSITVGGLLGGKYAKGAGT